MARWSAKCVASFMVVSLIVAGVMHYQRGVGINDVIGIGSILTGNVRLLVQGVYFFYVMIFYDFVQWPIGIMLGWEEVMSGPSEDYYFD